MRKIINDNSVRYIPKTEKTKERDIKPKTIKACSLPRRTKQKHITKQKKIKKNLAAGGSATITK